MKVTAAGEVAWIRVSEPSGNAVLDEAAAAAAWKANCSSGIEELVVWPVEFKIIKRAKGPELFP
jgi:TonB family protein